MNKTEVNLLDIDYDLEIAFEDALDEYKLKKSFLKLLMKVIKSKDFFIFKDKICLSYSSLEFHINNEDFYTAAGLFHSFKQTYSYLYWNETFNLLKIKELAYVYIRRFIVLKKPNPYSNCKMAMKSKCLNTCYRKYANLSKYFYESFENVTLLIDYDENNKSIIEHEKYCQNNECEGEDCKSAYSVIGEVKTYQKIRRLKPGEYEVYYDIESENRQLSYYNANPIKSNLDYHIELVGLFLLFIDISFYHLFISFFKIILTKIYISRNAILIIEFVSTFLCSIFAFLLIFESLNAYNTKLIKPIKTQLISSFPVQEPISAVICYKLYAYNRFRKEIENKTFLEIENKLDKKFDDLVRRIYLNFRNTSKNLEFKVASKVLLKFDEFVTYRCFQVDLRPKDSIYKNLFFISELTFLFNLTQFECFQKRKGMSFLKEKENYYFYLLPFGQNFNSKSQVISFYPNDYVKHEILRSNKNGNCVNYKEYSELKCVDQQDCLEKCYQKRLFESESTILDQTVIDKEQFSEEEWSNKKIEGIIGGKGLSNEIKISCERQFSKKDCKEVYFRSLNTGLIKYCRMIKLDLNYETLSVLEEEPSAFKLLLDILTIMSILFGLNLFRFTIRIFKNFSIKKNSLTKVRISLHIVCIIGSLFHLLLIFKEIINGDLIKSQHYEEQAFDMSDIVLCFDHNLNLSGGHFNYDSLNNSTQDLSIDTIFKEILYLNELNDWNFLNRTNGFEDNRFKIEIFYFLNEKCFNLKLNLTYNKEQFLFKDNKVVLRVDFNLTENKRYRFFTRKGNALFLNKKNILDYYPNKVRISKIREERLQINHYDRYALIKNLIEKPLSIFNKENHLNDSVKYLNDLQKNFKEKYNYTTLNLPLEHGDDLMINDKQFDDYVTNIQDLKDENIAPYLNFKRELVFHHIETKTLYSKNFIKTMYDFDFELFFFKR